MAYQHQESQRDPRRVYDRTADGGNAFLDVSPQELMSDVRLRREIRSRNPKRYCELVHEYQQLAHRGVSA
jgi:hypothetical protein